VGLVEASVLRTIADLPALRPGRPVGLRGPLTEMAKGLARIIDKTPLEAGSAASLSAIAKAHQELRATLVALIGAAGDSDAAQEFSGRMSTPTRDTENG
jgi:hypothetical protein